MMLMLMLMLMLLLMPLLMLVCLQELVQPHFLRRDKATVFGMGGKTAGPDAAGNSGGGGGGVAAACSAPVHSLQLTATKREWTVRHN
jgi:hypothetical protein